MVSFSITTVNSHLRETMVERKLISTTDKKGANTPRKNNKHNQVSTKTAGHGRSDTSPSGHSRCQVGTNESCIQQTQNKQ